MLAIGISKHRPFDDDYRQFMHLIANHVSSAISNGRAYEVEKERAEILAQLDADKDAFFSNVSHDFRTPLTLMLVCTTCTSYVILQLYRGLLTTCFMILSCHNRHTLNSQ